MAASLGNTRRRTSDLAQSQIPLAPTFGRQQDPGPCSQTERVLLAKTKARRQIAAQHHLNSYSHSHGTEAPLACLSCLTQSRGTKKNEALGGKTEGRGQDVGIAGSPAVPGDGCAPSIVLSPISPFCFPRQRNQPGLLAHLTWVVPSLPIYFWGQDRAPGSCTKTEPSLLNTCNHTAKTQCAENTKHCFFNSQPVPVFGCQCNRCSF